MGLMLADIWEGVADAIPDEVALVHGDRQLTFRDFDDRAARLASALAAAGLGPHSKVGLFLYNSPEYAEAHFAGFKMRAVPVNVNYRYLDDELEYLLDNADCEALVYHTSLGDRVERVRAKLPGLRLLLEVDDGGAHRVEGAVEYEDAIAAHEPAARIPREPDDTYMVYTGGTTGMPKGVMYAMGAFSEAFAGFASTPMGREPFGSVGEIVDLVRGQQAAGTLQTAMPCAPMMHAAGMWLGVMLPHLLGSRVVLLTKPSFDANELWETVEREHINSLVMVGDAFGRPMLRALEDRAASGTPYDTTSMVATLSTGAMLSAPVKEGLLEQIPQMIIIDALGSSEGAMAQNISMKGGTATTAEFQMMPGTKVFDENDQEITPGSDATGFVAVTGANVPVGYYKDEAKSARTFREIDGVRYSFPGDMARVEADGTVVLLGRGSACINTGGEKVFPEEVEEAIKTAPEIEDCLVFGVDDERFGQRVVGVVSARRDESVDPAAVIEHTKARLSHFKVPREVVVVEQVPRAPNGKADYGTARTLFTAASS
ncbi:MAG: AMP-binding protein [Acidimicrobiia bacterium]